MSHKIKFNIKKESFSDFIEKLSDLTHIDDTIKLKIDNEHILMYSVLGGNVMLAFKNYLIKTKEILQILVRMQKIILTDAVEKKNED